MTACPSCFQQIHPEKFAWVCVSPKCTGREIDPIAGRFLGYDHESGPVTTQDRPPGSPNSWRPRPTVFCRSCGEPSAEACPTCHFPLMEDWRTFNVTTVAMSGARATGKSLYIAVTVKQMEPMLAKMRSTIEPADSRTRDNYRTIYERPLFEQLGMMPPTARSDTDGSNARFPMIFSLGVLNGLRRILVIRDVAGEEMENVPENAPHLAFLRYADAVFFMFDPLAIDEVRKKLQDLVPHQINVGGDPKIVLGNLPRIIGTGTPRMAIILSKFDALQTFRDVNDVELKRIMSNPGAAYMRDPSLEKGTYDEDDGEMLSLEIESVLHKLGADNFVFSLQNAQGGRPLQHRFFAVSVLGESPDGDAVSKYGISPYRIVDPIKWLLHSKGII